MCVQASTHESELESTAKLALQWKRRIARYENTLALENNMQQMDAVVLSVSLWYKSGPETIKPASRKGGSAVLMSEYSPDQTSGVPTFILFGIHVGSNQPCLLRLRKEQQLVGGKKKKQK